MATATRYLTAEDVAHELDVHVVTVRRWLRSGKLKAPPPISRQMGYRIARKDLEDFLKSGGLHPENWF